VLVERLIVCADEERFHAHASLQQILGRNSAKTTNLYILFTHDEGGPRGSYESWIV